MLYSTEAGKKLLYLALPKGIYQEEIWSGGVAISCPPTWKEKKNTAVTQ